MTSGKVILITGASSGLGKSCAMYLGQKGHTVYGTSRKTDVDTKFYKMIQMDVNDDASIADGIRHIIAHEGRLDVVVNNAGIGIAGAVEDTDTDEIKSQFETNFFGVFRVCHEVLPVMRKQQSGYIVNIASIAGSIGIPFQGAYSASKAAVQCLTEVLRMEVKPFGIHVVVIDPGDFKTELTDNRIKTRDSQINPEYSQRFIKALQAMEKDELNGCEPVKFAKLIDKIINHSSPSLRYTTGPLLERAAVHIRKFMPAPLFEWLIMNNYNV
ncbi:MAG: SDR family oxidoreductase [Chlorobiaceae bacterium]